MRSFTTQVCVLRRNWNYLFVKLSNGHEYMNRHCYLLLLTNRSLKWIDGTDFPEVLEGNSLTHEAVQIYILAFNNASICSEMFFYDTGKNTIAIVFKNLLIKMFQQLQPITIVCNFIILPPLNEPALSF